MTIFFISDTHFGHGNILNFKDAADNPVRPGFTDVNHMNETMIDNWNKLVKPQDKIYHLGDVCFGGVKTAINILPRLNGHKRLVIGNHDNVVGHELYKYFDKIVAWNIFKDENFVVTHIPILRENFRKVGFNVHGHIHQQPDMSPNHINVCVEKTNYTPISMDEVKDRIRAK